MTRLRFRMCRTLPAVAILALGAACSDQSATGPDARRPLASAARVASFSRVGVQACPPEDKFIGRILVSTADVPGTWWYITRQGIDNVFGAGADYTAVISGWFGLSFASQDEAVQFLVDQVVPLDTNGNGYVCTYETRGVHAGSGLPYFNQVAFGVKDDKHAQ